MHNGSAMAAQRIAAVILPNVYLLLCSIDCCQHMLPFNLQTEDPAMERPYTFKDFLLRPRRSVSTERDKQDVTSNQ